jgi:subtilisin-like proprotein convertase family protein
MKNLFAKVARLSVAGIFIGFWAVVASAQTTTNYNFTFAPNRTVPDGNTSGVALTTNLTGMVGIITNLTLSLNISGGYNGDLYAYIRGPNGGFAILLNRPGVGNGDAFGYGDTGFNITFDDSSSFNNLHFYQDFSYSLNGSNALNGTWSSDGRAIDPLSNPSVFSTNVPSAFLDSFDGTDPNGTWTLFLADLSNGGESTVAGWSLDITTVPEPSTCSLLGIGFALFLARKRMNRSA